MRKIGMAVMGGILLGSLILAFVLIKDASVEEDLSLIQATKARIVGMFDGGSDNVIGDASWMHANDKLPDNPNNYATFDADNLEEIYLAGGCFWGLEAYLSRVYGVYDVTSGYANGQTENPSYEDVIYRSTGHAETVHVTYDPSLLDLETLMAYYLKVIDPTSLNKQGNDRGTQYRTGVYYVNEDHEPIIQALLDREQDLYDDPILVELQALDGYYLAEDYHQDYLEKNPNGYCHIDLREVEEDLSIYLRPSDEEIKQMLTPLQYHVTQEDGTESPFDNLYWDNQADGIYVDVVTGQPLFASRDKYKSGTGWPSFTKPISLSAVKEVLDKSLGIDRIEVRSTIGDSHLGHVFTDGPKDQGGLRYCMNSAALRFIAREDMAKEGYQHYLYLFD